MNISTESVELNRDCEAIQIPAGHKVKLVKGTKAVIEQYIRNQGRDKDNNQLKLFNL